MRRSFRCTLQCLALAGVMVAAAAAARGQSTAPCDSCATVPSLLRGWLHRPLTDTTFNIEDPDEGLVVRNVRRISRETIHQFGHLAQGLHVWYAAGDTCRDTTLVLSRPLLLRRGSLGGSYEPVAIPVRPAREFYHGDAAAEEGMFVDVGIIGLYGGADTSRRTTGFDKFMAGARVLVGTSIATDVRAALGGELVWEHGRLRIPLMGHLRWSPFGGAHSERFFRYAPSDCQFMHPGDPTAAPDAGGDYRQAEARGEEDSTVYFVEDVRQVRSAFRPFLFGEGGIIFNGGFEGAGAEPALNSSEYGQYMLGAGIGLPIAGPVVIAAGYRYMRLNLRTPCEACAGEFVVNTNKIHAIMLTIGLEFQ